MAESGTAEKGSKREEGPRGSDGLCVGFPALSATLTSSSDVLNRTPDHRRARE